MRALKAIRDELGNEEDKLALLTSRRRQGELEANAAEERARDVEAEVDALELRLSRGRRETDHLRLALATDGPRASRLEDEVLALRVSQSVDHLFPSHSPNPPTPPSFSFQNMMIY